MPKNKKRQDHLDVETLKLIHKQAIDHLKYLRFDADIISKVFVDLDESSNEKAKKKSLIEEAYAAYRYYAKQRFNEEMTQMRLLNRCLIRQNKHQSSRAISQ